MYLATEVWNLIQTEAVLWGSESMGRTAQVLGNGVSDGFHCDAWNLTH